MPVGLKLDWPLPAGRATTGGSLANVSTESTQTKENRMRLFLLLLLATPWVADAELVFRGQPIFRCESSWGTASCETLDVSRSDKLVDSILSVGGPDGISYLWGDDGRRLSYEWSNAFEYYYAAGVYVKVWAYKRAMSNLPSELRAPPPSLLPEPPPDYLYLLHTSLGLGSITYYGIARVYRSPVAE